MTSAFYQSRDQFIKKYYTDIRYDKATPDWFYVRQSLLASVKEHIPNFSGHVIDVGCGIMPYRELILAEGKVKKYTGIDFEGAISEEYAMGRPDLFWDGKTIPLEDNTANVAMATELLEHCADPEAVLTEIFRVLKPGGLLFFTVPFIWCLHITPYDEYRYTPFALQRFLTSAGFHGAEIKSLGGWHASLAQMLGLWQKNAPAPPRVKTLIGYIVKPLIKYLVKKDAGFDRDHFVDGTMMTGLTGIAYK